MVSPPSPEPSAEPLFREQVTLARRESWLGRMTLAQPASMQLLGAMTVAIALGVALFLVLGSYTQRVRVAGRLVPAQGLATVTTPVAGVVSRLDVVEGQNARAGQPLALVSVPRATSGSGDTIAALQRSIETRRKSLDTTLDAETRRLQAQQSSLSAQRTNARSELAEIDAQIDSRQQQMSLAEQTLAKLKELRESRYVSDLQTKQQEAAVLDIRAAVQALQRDRLAQTRLIAQLDQQLNEVPAARRLQSEDIVRSVAELERERIEAQASGEVQVSAPVDGTVSNRSVKIGQSVSAGQALLTLLPAGDRLEAELLVPSESIGFIAPGDHVLLRYDAYPYQRFGVHTGNIVRITRSALSEDELRASAAASAVGRSYYRVVVRLEAQSVLAYGKQQPLAADMRLQADILGRKRRLIEWVFDPLYALRQTVS